MAMITLCFFLACLVAVTMLVWFRSDALIEYARVLRWKGLWRDFKNARLEAGPDLFTLPHYLRKKWDCWLTRMLVCPLCFCISTSIAITVAITILISNVFFLVNAPVIIVFALILYGVITRLTNNL